MPQIHFTSNLQRHLACPTLEVDGETLHLALDAAFAANPKLRSYLLDEQGRLRRHVNIFINDRTVRDRVGLSDSLSPGDEIFIIQALTGG